MLIPRSADCEPRSSAPGSPSYFAGDVEAEEAGVAPSFLRTAPIAPATKQPTRKIPTTMRDLPRLPMGLFDRGLPCAGGARYPGLGGGRYAPGSLGGCCMIVLASGEARSAPNWSVARSERPRGSVRLSRTAPSPNADGAGRADRRERAASRVRDRGAVCTGKDTEQWLEDVACVRGQSSAREQRDDPEGDRRALWRGRKHGARERAADAGVVPRVGGLGGLGHPLHGRDAPRRRDGDRDGGLIPVERTSSLRR